jgi:hypothetical protein
MLVLQTHAKDPKTPVTLKAVASADYSAELTMETNPNTIYFFDGFLPNLSSKHRVVPPGNSDPGPGLGEEQEERELEAIDALIDSVLAETALDLIPEEKAPPEAGASRQA